MQLGMPDSFDYRGFSARPPTIKADCKGWLGELQNIHIEHEMIECGDSLKRPEILNANPASVPDS